MGRIKDAIDRVVVSYCTDGYGAPAADRRTATGAGMLASTAHNAGHPVAAAVISGLGAAVIVADVVVGHPEPPEDGYASFTTDGEKPRRGWSW
ncbi:hypothetical protein [Kitasatospora sp. NBC_01302]|uniref:hypothetical protein n=1 Tax=Kitasatospora sp. NBC_01302 TaxID=2903575 RepID=UPI002E0FF8D8|nr:hypothetical protein OG294_19595 [Kitasatospora sp. NBC_01302]